MANDVKAFTASKMRKMGLASATHNDPGKGVRDKTDDHGQGAANTSESVKLKRGGAVDGKGMKARLDRPGRSKYATGGAVKKKPGTTVNIVIGAGGKDKDAAPMPVPVPVPGPQASMPIPKPPMPMPQGMPAGGAPMPGPMPAPDAPPMMRKRGGRVNFTAGSASGPGRLQKVKAEKRFLDQDD